MSISSFINGTDLSKVEQRYINQFNKVDELSEAFENLGNSYLPLTGGTLSGNLNINTTSTANNSLTITDTTDSNIREFKFGDNLIYSHKILSNNAERKFEISTNKFEYSEGNNQLKIIPTDITIKTAANNKFENKLGSSSYINFYNNDNNCLYMGTTPNTSSNMIDWIVAGFKLQLSASGSLYKQANGFNSTLTSTSYNAYFNSAGGNSNSVSISGTNISWRGAQKASYSNPNYDTVDFSIDQNGFDYTGNWYSTQSATNPVQLRIYSGANHNLLYISHSVLNESNTSISITDETNDITISMRCDNGSNYSSVGIGGGNINLNKGFNNSFTHFSAGGGDLETSKDYTGFRFNLTSTSKTKGLTAFKADGVDVDFSIEGFHNIINDKFTLSDTYDTSALIETLTQDEIAWINDNGKDILAMIISLKRSLDNNSEEETEDDIISTTILTTKDNTNSVALKLIQYENNAFTIDWGDGTTENTDGKSVSTIGSYDNFTLTHNYETAGVYNIGISLNSDTANGDLTKLNTTQFTNMQVYKLRTCLVYDDDIITYKVNIPYINGDSGNAFVYTASVLNEVVIGELATTVAGIAYDCPNLTKATLQFDNTTEISDENYIFSSCPNLTEIHITSETPFDGSRLFDTEDIPTGLVIYVPSSAVDTYKSTASWSAFTSYIQGE